MHLLTTFFKKDNLLFALAYIFSFSATSCYFGFMVSFLYSYGYSPLEVNLLNTLLCVCSLVFQPLVAFIIDSYIPVKKYCLLSLSLSLFVVFLLSFTVSSHNILLVFLSVTLMSFTFSPVTYSMDSWLVELKNRNPVMAYRRIRTSGSLGFSLTALIMGNIVVKLSSFHVLVNVAFVLILLNMLIISFIPPVPLSGKPNIKNEKTTLKALFRIVSHNKFFTIFLLSNIFCFISIRPLLINFAYKMFEFGGNSQHIGASAAICAFVEIPLVFLAVYLNKKFKLSYLYLSALFIIIIRCVLLFSAQNMPTVIFSQVLQTVANAIIFSLPIEFINRALPQDMRATAGTAYTILTQGLASIIATILGGFIMQYLGFNTLTLISLTLTVISILIYVIPLYILKQTSL